MKRTLVVALLACAAAAASAAPGDSKADQQALNQLMAQPAPAKAAEPSRMESAFAGRGVGFWMLIGALIAAPVIIVSRRK